MWAADGPETTDLNFGMIALTDCSPIVGDILHVPFERPQNREAVMEHPNIMSCGSG